MEIKLWSQREVRWAKGKLELEFWTKMEFMHSAISLHNLKFCGRGAQQTNAECSENLHQKFWTRGSIIWFHFDFRIHLHWNSIF